MTDDRELSLILDRWLSEGPAEMSDRVVDVVAVGISRQRQRPAWRLDWRSSEMNTTLKLAAAVAAIAIVGLIGYNLFPGTSTGVGGPAPSAGASASAVSAQWWGTSGAGILPAGDGTTRFFVPGSTFRVPAGWVNSLDLADLYFLFQDTPANETQFALSRVPAQGIFMGTRDWEGLYVGTIDNYWANCIRGAGDTTSVDALVANEALVTSEPVDVAIGGLTGTRVDGYVDPDRTACSPDDKDYRGRFIYLDRPDGGKIRITLVSVHSADFEAFLAEAMPIVESLQFDTAP